MTRSTYIGHVSIMLCAKPKDMALVRNQARIVGELQIVILTVGLGSELSEMGSVNYGCFQQLGLSKIGAVNIIIERERSAQTPNC